jgi:bifunctional non-homologous end joining protein LigD
MHGVLRPRPPIGLNWQDEIKQDGYRIAVQVRILTRGGHNWTHRFPAIEHAAKRLGVGSAILDGEAVVRDEQGRWDFNKRHPDL